MSRTRMIKPAFFKHAELYQAEAESGLPLRLAFAGLWTVADKEGRFRWKMDLKPDILPYDPVDIMRVLDELEHFGFIARYVVDGKSYGLIPSFKDHQTFHKTERASTLPPPPNNVTASFDNVESTVRHMADTGTGTVTGTGTDLTALVDVPSTGAKPDPVQPKRGRAPRPTEPPLFGVAWAAYPRRAGSNPRTDALQQWLARVREGISEADMFAGTERYRAWCEAMGKIDTETVMQAKRFFGRNKEFADAWETPRPQPQQQEHFAARREREEREASEYKKITLEVNTRRAKVDGDLWWDRMRRECPSSDMRDVFRYAHKHIPEGAESVEAA